MQLIFLILVLYCYIEESSPISPPYSDSTWRPSRYIIDNRRNALFSKKPLLHHLQEDSRREPINFRLKSDYFKSRLLSIERYQKDLTAEASIAGPKFYRKYGENALPRKTGDFVKSPRINGGLGDPSEFNFGATENQKNSSGILDLRDFIQNEDFTEVTSKTASTTEKMQSWVPETGRNVLISMTPSTGTVSKSCQGSQPSEGLDFDSSSTTTFPWELENTKAEEGNQIDSPSEKHVYETRIETVSYHQEVMFNPPKKRNWLELKREPENYERPEENYEEQEKSYEIPEENYEAPEKNHEMDEVMPGGLIYPKANEENQNKFGYVVEGANYRKYRVEERTVDGFIVGEYGVVSHDDGSLRGVRYTADSNINPQLIYKTLIKFLSL